MDPATRALRSTLGSVLAFVATIAVTGLLPVSWRGGAFLVGLTLVAVLGITGGLAGRRALQAGTGHTGRTIAVSIVGLTLGVTAGITVALGVVSIAF